jgi:hypothetical protein
MDPVTKRRYVKIVYWGCGLQPDIEEAIEAEDYCKSYYIDDETVGRVDTYHPGTGLLKVSYELVAPPFDALVAEHFRLYPGVLCDVCTEPRPTGDGGKVLRVDIYRSVGEVQTRLELHYDRVGDEVRRIILDENGNRLREERRTYDADGKWLSTAIFDADGKPGPVLHRDDD